MDCGSTKDQIERLLLVANLSDEEFKKVIAVRAKFRAHIA